MSTEKNEKIDEKLEKMPTLTFGSAGEEKQHDSLAKEEILAVEVAEVEKKLTLENLPTETQEMIENFVKEIDISDSLAVTEYGTTAQNRISSTSNAILQATKTKDLGAVGQDLLKLMDEIEGFDPNEDQGFFKNIFNKGKSAIRQMTKAYEDVEVTIDGIVNNLNGHKMVLFKDIAMLDELYEANLAYFNELNLYIVAGEEKLKLVHDQEIPTQRKLAEETKSDLEIQKLNDLAQASNRFEKKVHDLRLTRNISIQMAPQIRMIQNNDQVLVEKIQSSITNAIPLWKNQMVIALGLANAKEALEAQTRVSNMTNELLLKNSEMLKQGTIDIAKEAEAGIVSVDTIRTTNENLIATIKEVVAIQKEGTQARLVAENELIILEENLKQAMIEHSK